MFVCVRVYWYILYFIIDAHNCCFHIVCIFYLCYYYVVEITVCLSVILGYILILISMLL